MKKFFYLMLALCLTMAGPARAFDADDLNELTITNGTGKIIKYLFISPDDSNSWGPDMLGTEVIGTGKAVTYYMLYPERTGDFDILAVADDNQRYEVLDFRLTDGAKASMTLSPKNRTERQAPQLVNVTLHNKTGFKMAYVFFSPADSVMYGADILGSTFELENKKSHSFAVIKPSADLKYDLYAVDEDGDEYKFQVTVRPGDTNVAADIELSDLVTK